MTLHYGASGPILSVGMPARRVTYPTRMAAQFLGPGEHAAAVTKLPARTTFDWFAACSGVACVYNRVLDDGAGGKEWFAPRCFSDDHDAELPLLLDHDAERHAGWVVLDNGPDALHLRDGQIRRGALAAIGSRHDVSIGFMTVAAANVRGVVRRYKCRIVEVSIVDRGAHTPHSRLSIVGPSTLDVAA